MPDTVLLKVDIYHKPARTEFVIMHTPARLWDILPMKAQYIQKWEGVPDAFFKRWQITHKGHIYEITFYFTKAKGS
jgi:hypothetical protein